MTVKQFAQQFEMKFWDFITPVMGEKGPIVRAQTLLYRVFHNKTRYFILLVIVWAAVGFLAGLVIGRLIGIVPLS